MEEEKCNRACECDNSAVDTDVDWTTQNKLRAKWLQDNPNAKYIGWTSI